MMDYRDVLIAIDGALHSAAALYAFTEEGQPVHHGLTGVIAALETAHTLIVEQLPGPNEGDGTCPHPQDQRKVTLVGGGGKVIICGACNEMLAE